MVFIQKGGMSYKGVSTTLNINTRAYYLLNITYKTFETGDLHSLRHYLSIRHTSNEPTSNDKPCQHKNKFFKIKLL